MPLSDVKLVDLRKSVVDDENSDPKNGIYRFKDKVYVSRRIIRDPDYKLKWGTKDKAHSFMQQWRTLYNADFVTMDDGVYAEGAYIDESGHFCYGDAVLMKIPLQIYIDKVERERSVGDKRLKSMQKQFSNAIQKDQSEALSPEEVAEMRGY